MDIDVYPPDSLQWNGRQFRCALGRGGVRRDKAEGDGATPVGRWRLRAVFYRPDRIEPPQTDLIVRPLADDDGWCDDPSDDGYNRHIKKPFGAGHENLWRDDHVYDLIVILGHNDSPPIAGKGSAIFMHVAKPDFSPTEGCVALSLGDLLWVIEGCGPQTWIAIHPEA